MRGCLVRWTALRSAAPSRAGDLFGRASRHQRGSASDESRGRNILGAALRPDGACTRHRTGSEADQWRERLADVSGCPPGSLDAEHILPSAELARPRPEPFRYSCRSLILRTGNGLSWVSVKPTPPVAGRSCCGSSTFGKSRPGKPPFRPNGDQLSRRNAKMKMQKQRVFVRCG